MALNVAERLAEFRDRLDEVLRARRELVEGLLSDESLFARLGERVAEATITTPSAATVPNIKVVTEPSAPPTNMTAAASARKPTIAAGIAVATASSAPTSRLRPPVATVPAPA
ncbi:hypothetical protein Q0Z83_054280 [Actinoplanes sichuanensis]|uniref:Uncharacterized protein n=1 Tax=Actinoplanes sichuanensis TaxID=512349 RepID=A0ABW4AAW6_9ACTN|nr:hypothetical protein [Actinoplanes sichuanensis]BEL07237.1 hypothetical protein Q0Z83_054280 [Actinoplanes sichuanensis]